MKTTVLFILILTGIPVLASAQTLNGWDFGVSAELGKSYFERRYAVYYDQYPDMLRNFKSRYSWGAGVWLEKHFNSHLSGIVRANYMQNDMHPDDYGQPSRTANKYFVKEKHHHLIADIGGRWYVNPGSELKLFADLKLGANTFMAIDLYEQQDGKETNRGIYGFSRFLPVGLAAIGAQYNRFALSIEYNRDLNRAKLAGLETSILRQGFAVKGAFAIVKSH